MYLKNMNDCLAKNYLRESNIEHNFKIDCCRCNVLYLLDGYRPFTLMSQNPLENLLNYFNAH